MLPLHHPKADPIYLHSTQLNSAEQDTAAHVNLYCACPTTLLETCQGHTMVWFCKRHLQLCMLCPTREK